MVFLSFFICVVLTQQKITFQITQSQHLFYFAQLALDGLKYSSIVDTGSGNFLAKGWGCGGPPLTKLKVAGNKNCDQKAQLKIPYTLGKVQGKICTVKFKASKEFLIKIIVFTICQKSIEPIQAVMALSSNNNINFVQILENQKVITNRKISIYFSVPKGKLIIGAIQTASADTTKSSFNRKYETTFHFIFQSMFVGSKEKTYTGLKIIVDTGNSYSLVPQDFLTFMKDQLIAVYQNKSKCTVIPRPRTSNLFNCACLQLTKADKAKLPTFSMKFQSVFVFRPELFSLCNPGKPNTQNCMFNLVGDKTRPTYSIMGINLMRDMLVLIDHKEKQFNLHYLKKR